jgi:hypothetical protein
MTDEEWRFHRQHSVSIPTLGECSRMRDGRFKIEGHAPMTEEELRTWLPRTPLDRLLSLR